MAEFEIVACAASTKILGTVAAVVIAVMLIIDKKVDRFFSLISKLKKSGSKPDPLDDLEYPVQDPEVIRRKKEAVRRYVQGKYDRGGGMSRVGKKHRGKKKNNR